MMQQDERGYWVPTKIFPCDCGSEAISVASYDWDEGETYFSISFWKNTPKFSKENVMGWKTRLRLIWGTIRGKPWIDMVDLTPQVAKNLANHILYQLEKTESKKPKYSEKDRIVWPENEKIREDHLGE